MYIVTVLDISNPQSPSFVKDIDMSTYGGGVNSVAVFNGIVAVAVEGATSLLLGGNHRHLDEQRLARHVRLHARAGRRVSLVEPRLPHGIHLQSIGSRM